MLVPIVFTIERTVGNNAQTDLCLVPFFELRKVYGQVLVSSYQSSPVHIKSIQDIPPTVYWIRIQCNLV